MLSTRLALLQPPSPRSVTNDNYQPESYVGRKSSPPTTVPPITEAFYQYARFDVVRVDAINQNTSNTLKMSDNYTGRQPLNSMYIITSPKPPPTSPWAAMYAMYADMAYQSHAAFTTVACTYVLHNYKGKRRRGPRCALGAGNDTRNPVARRSPGSLHIAPQLPLLLYAPGSQSGS